MKKIIFLLSILFSQLVYCQDITKNGEVVGIQNSILPSFTSNTYPLWNGTAWTAGTPGGGGSGITALTGDGSASGTGSVPFTLTTVNSNIGSFGSATQVPVSTYNAKGLCTGVTLANIAIPYSALTGSIPTWNQNTTGTSANITGTSNSTLTTLSSLSLPFGQVTGFGSSNVITALGFTPASSGINPPTNSSIALGTSIMYGLNNVAGTQLSSPYILQYGNYCGVTINNLAISGTGARKAYFQLSNNLGLTPVPIYTDAYFNNVRVASSLKAVRYAAASAGTRASCALNWSTNLNFIYSGTGTLNSNVTLTNPSNWAINSSSSVLLDYGSRATWYKANISSQSGCGMAVDNSVTTNETMTIKNIAGYGIVVATWGTDGVTNNWSRIQYAVDGVTIGTYTPNGNAYLGFPDGGTTDGLMNDAIVVTGLVDTLHTIVLTFLDGGKPSKIDYVAGLISPKASSLAPYNVMAAYHMTNGASVGYNFPSFVTTQAVIDSATIAVTASQSTTFSGYTSVPINTNASYVPSSTTTQPDGVHPWNLGDTQILLSLTATLPQGFVSQPTNSFNLNQLSIGGGLYSKYPLAVSSNSVPSININNGTSPGGFSLGSIGAGSGYCGAGMYYDNFLSSYYATNTSAVYWGGFNGVFQILANTGLTAGNTYTPNPILYISPTGNAIGQGTTNGYTLELNSSSTNFTNKSTQLRFGNSNSDNGGYLVSVDGTNAGMSGGMAYNGTNWIAKATSAGDIFTDAGTWTITANTGLTIGSSFSPSARVTVSGTQVSVLPTTASTSPTTGCAAFAGGVGISGAVNIGGNLVSSTVGNGIQLKTGTNARIGTSTLASGTITVSNTSVTASTKIVYSNSGASGTVGALSCVKTAGTGFVFTSTSPLDNSSIDWILVEGN